MGYIKHHAIIVTSWNEDHLKIAHKKAIDFGLHTTKYERHRANEGFTFLVLPDGSKEYWELSDLGDQKRKNWVDWVKKSELYIDWVVVSYGGDDPHLATIEEHNNIQTD